MQEGLHPPPALPAMEQALDAAPRPRVLDPWLRRRLLIGDPRAAIGWAGGSIGLYLLGSFFSRPPFNPDPIQLLIMAVPLCLFPVVVIFFRRGRRIIRLLEIGSLAVAKETRRPGDRTRRSHREPYDVSLVFVDRDGRTVELREHVNRLDRLPARPAVIYDPANPSDAMAVDLLPGLPFVVEGDVVRSERGKLSLVMVLGPVLIVSAGAWMLLALLRSM
ncbi:MAG TPA: hypothetical protein VGE07_25435 [Herpetosiphonaceae bacterium]